MYVGKATSLRSRVKSYFLKNLAETRSPLISAMVEQASDIGFTETDSVLEALILEARLIKEIQPYHNTDGKDDKSFNYVIITKERFPRVLVMRGRELEKKQADHSNFAKAIYGPFPNGGSLREAMRIVRKIFPYRTKCIPADELPVGKTPRPCFEKQIGLCPGVCTGETSAQEYARIIRHLMMFFDGRKKALLTSLEKEMKTYAKAKEFEKANQTKRTVFALQHIQDVALIRREKSGLGNLENAGNGEGESRGDGEAKTSKKNRIEAYDIAHMSGKSTAGVMTVVENGEANSAEYRMFKIRLAGPGDDIKALGEVLTRRFNHPEWSFPSLIAIDGGETHLKHAREILKNLNIEIPTVAVVKGPDHKPKDVIGDQPSIEAYKAEILLANSEAHRFAIKYHKNLRRRAFL